MANIAKQDMKNVKPAQETTVTLFKAETATELALPLVNTSISAGFPSPALDFIDLSIDLNRHLIAHPSATFYGRVKGQSMKDAGIHDGDLLVIDKSLEPASGKIAVCSLDGDFTLKRIRIDGGELWLMPANESYSPIKVGECSDLRIWGIVTFVIKSV